MSKLNEAAFLRSLSLDDEELEQPRGSCPQPSILWMLMQKDRSGSAMAEDLRNHIAVCPSCLDLTRRLYAFHRSVQGEVNRKAEESWAESRPKLNQWIDTFLNDQEQAKAQPAPKPLVLVNPPSRRKLFSLSWAIPLAGAVAVLAILMIVQSRHADKNAAAQMASAPIRPEDNSPSGPSLNAPSSSSGQQLMMNKGVPAEDSAAEVPETISFYGGERMKLQLSSVEAQDDGSYRVRGTLSPVAPLNTVFDSAEVSGIFRPAQPQGRLQLKIAGAELKNRSYRVATAEVDDLLEAIAAGEHAAPQAGQAMEIEVERGPSLRLQP